MERELPEGSSAPPVSTERAVDIAFEPPGAESSAPSPLEDSDLLFHVFHFADCHTLRSLVAVARAWRMVAMRQDLPHWRSLDAATFAALEPAAFKTNEGASKRWSCERVTAACIYKPQLTALDLSGAGRTSTLQATRRLAECLPTSLQVLSLCDAGMWSHPDAMIDALLSRAEALPLLHSLDLQAVCTERTLAGMRLLKQRKGEGCTELRGLVRSLPALRRLAVGFHLLTAIGHREGCGCLTSVGSVRAAPRALPVTVTVTDTNPGTATCLASSPLRHSLLGLGA